MQAGQVSVWVPIAVGVIGLVGVIVGQLINTWREDRRWRQEQEREDLRWRRESLVDWRERRINAYVEYLELLNELINLSANASDDMRLALSPLRATATPEDIVNSLKKEYERRWEVKNVIEQRIRLLASEKIVSVISEYSVSRVRLPDIVYLNDSVAAIESISAAKGVPVPESVRQSAESATGRVPAVLKEHVTNVRFYYQTLIDQMREDLGATSS